MESRYDCVVCGSCVVDVLVRPVELSTAIGAGRLVRTEPLVLTTGGIVSNSGITLARLGMRVATMTYVGDDPWADTIRQSYAAAGIDTSHLLTHPTEPTSTTAVMIDPSGERSFLHAVGAPKQLDRAAFLDRLELFASSRAMLLGYFPLLPNLLDDLPEVLAAIRQTGCLTALDTAGDGGTLDGLAPSLPHLDFYVPSLSEAQHQTGESDPPTILATYRDAGAAGLLGIKLGEQGALLSPSAGEFIDVPPVQTAGGGDRHNRRRRLLSRRAAHGHPPRPRHGHRRPASPAPLAPPASPAWVQRQRSLITTRSLRLLGCRREGSSFTRR